MERRAILAAVLMAGLLLVYQLLFVKPNAPQAPSPPKEAPAAPVARLPEPQAPPAAVPVREAAAVPDRRATVLTPLYRANVSSQGGRFESWDLDYRGQKPMVVNGELGPRGLAIRHEGEGGEARRVGFALSTDAVTLGKDASEAELTLTGEDGFGLAVSETMRFQAQSYVVEHDFKIVNRNTVPQRADVMLTWRAPVEWPKDEVQKFNGQHPTRTVRLVDGSATREVLEKISGYHGPGKWVGLESEWYLTALIPVSGQFQVMEAKEAGNNGRTGKAREVAEVGLRAALPTLQPGEVWEGRVLTYVGPKEYARLKALGFGLEKSIYFGGFPLPQAYGGLPMEWLAVPILVAMHVFYSYTHNYGIAIILLTVITKLLFFPLTIKSMTSMRAMQALQPQINALRAKYKSDSQRLQQETMALYRQHKVNPLGGCLPMIVQIPIFYALYVALSVSVDLQNQPFICLGHLFGTDLWICDLAAHDPTYVLPILMGASMFIQQKMTPVMGDPRQAKMMLLMPIVFTFMFLNLPSGLVLYWTLSNVLQIAQQKYMERTTKRAEKAPARAARKA
jgi:YidC/Oxa1 family membrane protein insertase